MTSSLTHQAISAAENLRANLENFLRRGWCLALNSERIAVGWGSVTRASSPSDTGEGELSSECWIYSPDFHLREIEPWRKSEVSTVLSRAEFTNVLGGSNLAFSQSNIDWVEPDQESFNQQFSRIREGMASRGLKKAVPVVFATAHSDVDLRRRRAMLTSALQTPGHLFVYGEWDETSGLLGVTPELLFSQSGTDVVQTVAVAGTRKREEGAAEILLADPKERAEHQFVIDDIRAVLKTFGEIEVAQTGAVELPTLVHLKTQIALRLRKQVSFDDLVRALHPTPALGVAPRELGFAEMRIWDSDRDRQRFGAPFGLQFGSERLCVVAIRNIQWSNHEVLLGSGCGIIAESRVEREWAELRLKRDSVRGMLGV